MKFLIPAIAAALIAVGCGATDDTTTSEESSMTTITGELVYRERISLIPGGTATITLDEVTPADEVSPAIAATTIDLGDQQIPISFELAVESSDLADAGDYSLSATISNNQGDLEWTTDDGHPIDLDQPAVDVGSLWLVQAGADEPGSDGASPIVGEWTVSAIDGSPVADDSFPTLVFEADGTLGGNASCNTFFASYATTGDTLSLTSEVATTLMACEPAINQQEQAFLAVLYALAAEGGGSLDISGDELLLTAGDGATLKAHR